MGKTIETKYKNTTNQHSCKEIGGSVTAEPEKITDIKTKPDENKREGSDTFRSHTSTNPTTAFKNRKSVQHRSDGGESDTLSKKCGQRKYKTLYGNSKITKQKIKRKHVYSTVKNILPGGTKKNKFALSKGNINNVATLENNELKAQCTGNEIILTSGKIKNSSLCRQSNNLPVDEAVKQSVTLDTDMNNEAILEITKLKEQITSTNRQGRSMKSQLRYANLPNGNRKMQRELSNDDVLKESENSILPCNVMVKDRHHNKCSKSNKATIKNALFGKKKYNIIMETDNNNNKSQYESGDKSNILEKQDNNKQPSKNVAKKSTQPKLISKKLNILGYVRKSTPSATGLHGVVKIPKLSCDKNSRPIEESHMPVKMNIKMNHKEGLKRKSKNAANCDVSSTISLENIHVSKKELLKKLSDKSTLDSATQTNSDKCSTITKDKSMQVPYTARFKRFQNNRSLGSKCNTQENSHTVPFVRSKPLFFRVHDNHKGSKISSKQKLPNSLAVINEDKVEAEADAVNSKGYASIHNNTSCLQKRKNVCLEVQTESTQTKDKTCNLELQKNRSTREINVNAYKKVTRTSLKDCTISEKLFPAEEKEHPVQTCNTELQKNWSAHDSSNDAHKKVPKKITKASLKKYTICEKEKEHPVQVVSTNAVKLDTNAKKGLNNSGSVKTVTATIVSNVKHQSKSQDTPSLDMSISSSNISGKVGHTRYIRIKDGNLQHIEKRIHSSCISLPHRNSLKNVLSSEVESQLCDSVGVTTHANSEGVKIQGLPDKSSVVTQQNDFREPQHPPNTTSGMYMPLQSTHLCAPVLMMLPTTSAKKYQGQQIGNYNINKPAFLINPVSTSFTPGCNNHDDHYISVADDQSVIVNGSDIHNIEQSCQINRRFTNTTLQYDVNFPGYTLGVNHATEHNQSVATPYMTNDLLPISSCEQSRAINPISDVFTTINSTEVVKSKNELCRNLPTTFQSNTVTEISLVKGSNAPSNNMQSLLQYNACLSGSNYKPIPTVSTIAHNNLSQTMQNNLSNASCFIPTNATPSVREEFGSVPVLQNTFPEDTNCISINNLGVYSDNVLQVPKENTIPGNCFDSVQDSSGWYDSVFSGSKNMSDCMPTQHTTAACEKWSTVQRNFVSGCGYSIPMMDSGTDVSANTSQQSYATGSGNSYPDKDYLCASNVFNNGISPASFGAQPLDNVITSNNILSSSTSNNVAKTHSDNFKEKLNALLDEIASLQESQQNTQVYNGPVMFPTIQHNLAPDSSYNVGCNVAIQNNVPVLLPTNVHASTNVSKLPQTHMPHSSGYENNHIS